MKQTVEAIIDEQGHVRLVEPVKIKGVHRALVTILDEPPIEDTLWSLSQFRVGTGDHTAERHKMLEGLSVKDIVREIKQSRSE